MTPFAVIQRAARLAPELDRLMPSGALVRAAGEPVAWRVEEILTALDRAGLTLEADMSHPGVVAQALTRLGPTGPAPA